MPSRRGPRHKVAIEDEDQRKPRSVVRSSGPHLGGQGYHRWPNLAGRGVRIVRRAALTKTVWVASGGRLPGRNQDQVVLSGLKRERPELDNTVAASGCSAKTVPSKGRNSMPVAVVNPVTCTPSGRRDPLIRPRRLNADWVVIDLGLRSASRTLNSRLRWRRWKGGLLRSTHGFKLCSSLMRLKSSRLKVCAD